MDFSRSAVVILVCLASGSATTLAAELKAETLAAFAQHISSLEERLKARQGGEKFLGLDDTAERREEMRRGAIRIEPSQGSGILDVKGGLIQDWTGTVFIPGVSLSHVLSIVQDYPKHAQIYKPEIVGATVQSHSGNDYAVRIRIVKSKLFLSVVLKTDHQIHFTTLSPEKAYSQAQATRIAEVAEAGKPGEHELPVGKDRGLLWGMRGYWFFEEADGGVYVQCQSVTLTRDVPFGMGKLFSPILRTLPTESLRGSLEKTRAAALAKR